MVPAVWQSYSSHGVYWHDVDSMQYVILKYVIE